MSAEIENAVDAKLAEHSVTVQVTYLCEADDGGWKHDLWRVEFIVFGKPTRRFTTEFKTGLGHRKGQVGTATPFGPTAGKPKMPKAASILHSLCLDAQCGDTTFPDFCRDLGYDEDSRKALETYLACQKVGEELHKLFGSALLAELTELVGEY